MAEHRCSQAATGDAATSIARAAGPRDRRALVCGVGSVGRPVAVGSCISWV